MYRSCDIIQHAVEKKFRDAEINKKGYKNENTESNNRCNSSY